MQPRKIGVGHCSCMVEGNRAGFKETMYGGNVAWDVMCGERTCEPGHRSVSPGIQIVLLPITRTRVERQRGVMHG